MRKNLYRNNAAKFICGLIVFLGMTLVLGSLAATYFRSSASSPNSQSLSLSLAERVSYERKLQAVYFKHRVYPETNQQRKPTLDEILPLDATQAKVEDLLRKENALEQSLNIKITPAMLQAEIERMSRETREPKILRELWNALGNDPRLVAECLARPILVERLTSANKTDSDDSSATVKSSFPSEISEQLYAYNLPEIGAGGDFSDDTWKSLPALPNGYSEHTIVWTGAEALVWGGTTTSAVKTNAGSRYNPATDSWSPITGSGAPTPRRAHTAIWTGTEMIVWGGCGTSHQFCGASSGGRYNPATDSWLPTSMTGVPNPRLDHTAVWTGDRMIVFGGCTPNANFTSCPSRDDGGMYFPATDSWVATSLTNAPTARRNHTAVWTGTEMLIWGGMSDIGGRFDPNTNSWTTMNAANAPESRERHTAVWTGTEMIVWGGSVTSYIKLNTGGRYNPTSDSWTPTNTANAPEARYLHTAIWTGTEMIIWGGNTATLGENFLNSGAKYNPANDSWTSINTATAPLPRENHKAVWTGSEMIVWGGRNYASSRKTGSRYNPATDSWIPTGTNDAPLNNLDSKGVWTGAEMIVFGGSCCGTNVGGRYDPATAVWTPIRTLSEIAELDAGFTLVWTGTEMIVWGGGNSFLFRDGARYNPAKDTWILISKINAPSARSRHSAVWTGSEMIIWGGQADNGKTNTGGRYNPSTDSWTPTSIANAPEPRYLQTAVIVGNQMIVWGGSGATDFLNTGGRYDFTTDSWRTVSTAGAPTKRYFHTAISTGTEMIVWGGRFTNVDSDSGLNTGGRYNPTTDVWTPSSQTNAPSPRSRHTAVWTGSEMIVYAGNMANFFQYFNDGGRYNPATDSWRPTSLFKVGIRRADHIAVWTGRSMLVWGGQYNDGDSRVGYEYFANSAVNRTKFDFDGDGKADISVYRNGTWHLQQSANGYLVVQFGLAADKIVPADYDGDGKTDVAVYRDGTWYIFRSSDAQVSIFQFGLAGDIPQAGDYDGDGKADLAVFRPSDRTWYLLQSTNGFSATQFGFSDDTPVSGDYDGDGKMDIAVYRPSDGVWYLLRSRDGFISRQYGISTDIPVPADYDGDGKTDLAVYRDGNWYLLRSRDGDLTYPFGSAGDKPAPADYDGDGKADLVVYRQGAWYTMRSSDNNYSTIQFGLATDIPIPSAYLR